MISVCLKRKLGLQGPCWLQQELQSTMCAMYSLEPLAQGPRNEIMDLRLVNQFIPLPLPCSALPGAWKWSCRRNPDLVIWAVYTVKITLRTGCEILFSANTQARPKGSLLAQCVLNVCCWQCIAELFRDRDILFWTTKPARSIWTYFVSKMFHDCIVFNIVG